MIGGLLEGMKQRLCEVQKAHGVTPPSKSDEEAREVEKVPSLDSDFADFSDDDAKSGRKDSDTHSVVGQDGLDKMLAFFAAAQSPGKTPTPSKTPSQDKTKTPTPDKTPVLNKTKTPTPDETPVLNKIKTPSPDKTPILDKMVPFDIDQIVANENLTLGDILSMAPTRGGGDVVDDGASSSYSSGPTPKFPSRAQHFPVEPSLDSPLTPPPLHEELPASAVTPKTPRGFQTPRSQPSTDKFAAEKLISSSLTVSSSNKILSGKAAADGKSCAKSNGKVGGALQMSSEKRSRDGDSVRKAAEKKVIEEQRVERERLANEEQKAGTTSDGADSKIAVEERVAKSSSKVENNLKFLPLSPAQLSVDDKISPVELQKQMSRRSSMTEQQIEIDAIDDTPTSTPQKSVRAMSPSVASSPVQSSNYSNVASSAASTPEKPRERVPGRVSKDVVQFRQLESDLHKAVFHNDRAAVQRFLEKTNANPNAKNPDLVEPIGKKSTPLHIAAMKGFTKIAKRLLIHGADSSAVTSRGRTPMDVARHCGHQEIVDLLNRVTRSGSGGHVGGGHGPGPSGVADAPKHWTSKQKRKISKVQPEEEKPDVHAIKDKSAAASSGRKRRHPHDDRANDPVVKRLKDAYPDIKFNHEKKVAAAKDAAGGDRKRRKKNNVKEVDQKQEKKQHKTNHRDRDRDRNRDDNKDRDRDGEKVRDDKKDKDRDRDGARDKDRDGKKDRDRDDKTDSRRDDKKHHKDRDHKDRDDHHRGDRSRRGSKDSHRGKDSSRDKPDKSLEQLHRESMLRGNHRHMFTSTFKSFKNVK